MSADGPGRREVAYRVFAAEYDAADYSYSAGEAERAPNYVVTPTGARVNRLFLVGVLTEVEPAGENQLRARVVDPTGAFVVYAGQYQPDALAFFDGAEPPMFVAVTGKANTFQPEGSDRVFTSVRPESVNEVDAETRDRWVVQTARQTTQRVAAFATALQLGLEGDELEDALRERGVREGLAAGIARALAHYGTTPAYLAAVRNLALDAARVVAGEREEVEPLSAAPDAPGDADLDALADADVPVEAPPGTAAEPAGAAVAEARTEEGSRPAEPGAEGGAVQESGSGEESAGAPTDEGVEAAADGELGDFEPGDLEPEEFELDEEERRAVEEEYGVEFETGAEVDSSGEVDVDASEPGAETADAEAPAEAVDSEAAEDEPKVDREAEGKPGAEARAETEAEAEAETEEEAEGTERAGTGAEATGTEESEATGTEEAEAVAVEEAETEAEESKAEAEEAEEAEEVEEAEETEAETEETEAETEETEAEGVEPEEVDLEEAVMETMRQLDDGDGADREALVATVADEYGAAEDEIEDAIQDALMSGRCYEPDEDRLKPI